MDNITLYDYIAKCDRVYPNMIDASEKESWLCRLEEKLRLELSCCYAAEPSSLAAVYPYDTVYTDYLKMLCAEASGDISRYNNYLAAYNASLNELYAYYARCFTPREREGWKNVI